MYIYIYAHTLGWDSVSEDYMDTGKSNLDWLQARQMPYTLKLPNFKKIKAKAIYLAFRIRFFWFNFVLFELN